MVSFFLRIKLDHYCAKLTFAYKSKTVGVNSSTNNGAELFCSN